MKYKGLFICFAIFLFAGFLRAGEVKYVFLLIGDGYGENQRALTERYYGKKLRMSSLGKTVRMGTNNIDGKTTDSAASGTALACGQKTCNGAIAMLPDGTKLESISKKLKKHGFKIGMISSSHLTDATIATHYANQKSRRMYNEITQDLVKSGFDFFGGTPVAGDKSMNILGYNNSRGELVRVETPDSADIMSHSPYTILGKGNVLDGLKNNTLYCVFSEPYTPWNPGEPPPEGAITHADYLKKAIALFSDSQKGFFIMLENGRTDYAGHENDAGKLVREGNELDEALAVALEFQYRHPDETLIILTADHETGGLDLLSDDYNPALLKRQTMPKIELQKRLSELLKATPDSKAEVLAMTETALGIKFSDTERKKLGSYLEKPADAPAKITAKAFEYRDARIGIRYTTGGHTNRKVLCNAQGPSAELFCEPLENTDVANLIEEIVLKSNPEYRTKRDVLLHEYQIMEPLRAAATPCTQVSVSVVPDRILKTVINGVEYQASLPDASGRVSWSSGILPDKSFLIEIENLSRTFPVLFGIQTNFDQAMYHLSDPVSPGTYYSTAENPWMNSPHLNDLACYLGPNQKTHLRLVRSFLFTDGPPKNHIRTILSADAEKAYAAAPKTPIKTMKIPRIKNLPVIDGKGDDEVWNEVNAQPFMGKNGGEPGQKILLKCALNAPGDVLYVFAELNDTEIVAKSSAHDSAVYDDDCLELFLGAFGSKTFAQIVINSENAVYDAKDGDSQWKATFEHQTIRKSDRAWSVEMAIPLKQFEFSGLPTINFCVYDKPTGGISVTAPNGGTFQKPETFLPIESPVP